MKRLPRQPQLPTSEWEFRPCKYVSELQFFKINDMVIHSIRIDIDCVYLKSYKDNLICFEKGNYILEEKDHLIYVYVSFCDYPVLKTFKEAVVKRQEIGEETEITIDISKLPEFTYQKFFKVIGFMLPLSFTFEQINEHKLILTTDNNCTIKECGKLTALFYDNFWETLIVFADAVTDIRIVKGKIVITIDLNNLPQ
jgi:hypothetical protein